MLNLNFFLSPAPISTVKLIYSVLATIPLKIIFKTRLVIHKSDDICVIFEKLFYQVCTRVFLTPQRISAKIQTNPKKLYIWTPLIGPKS